MVTYQDCDDLLSEVKVPDDRWSPDINRRHRETRFRKGWQRATTVGAEPYGARALKKLTWDNLGYRAGKRFGELSDGGINACYELFARLYYAEADNRLSEQLDARQVFYEGAKQQITINKYEREPQARKQCVCHYGTCCTVCGFDYGKTYGEAGAGYIQVHHLTQLSTIGKQYKVDPISDLRPVCANCHAIIHRRTPAYSIEEVQGMLTHKGGQRGHSTS